MAGTFPGLCNTQQFDVNGNPLVGGQLSVFNGGTQVLANLYQDIGLSIAQSNPINISDASGRLPIFFVADGVYRVRLLDANGVTGNGGFDYPQVPSIGASSSGGGGTSVDPTTIANTGDPIWVPIAGARSGWVRMNGRTIGSATSGASERANADTQALFLFIWNNFTDAQAPVPGGRGVTALADWGANKQITIPDMRGRTNFGLDDMGNLAAGRFTGATFISGNSTTAFSIGGEPSHTLTRGESPTGLITGVFNDTSHSHGIGIGASGTGTPGSAPPAPGAVRSGTYNSDTSTTGASITLTDHAGDGAHNNMPNFALGTWHMKL